MRPTSKASQPDGPHSYENAGKTVDVTGKGGVIEDSNAEASKPSDGSENLPTAGRDSDDAGFNKDKNTDDWSDQDVRQLQRAGLGCYRQGILTTLRLPSRASSPSVVRTFSPSAARTSSRSLVHQPAEGYRSVDRHGRQWRHASAGPGNQEGRSQHRAGKKAAFSHVVAAMKLADAEVELGLLDKELKYDRVAELEALSEEELAAEERVISRVKTAGLTKKVATRREAATREGEVSGRLPSFSKKAGELEPKQATPVDDALADASLFLR
jgi:hypothetical protein